MNNETMIFENDELSVEYKIITGETIKGARDSLGGVAGMGPPLEPDETEYACQIAKVTFFDLDLTDKFSQDPMDEDVLYDHVCDTFKSLIQEKK